MDEDTIRVRRAFNVDLIDVLLVGGPYHWRTVTDIPLDQAEFLFADTSQELAPVMRDVTDPNILTPHLTVHRYMQWSELTLPDIETKKPTYIYKYMESR